MTFLFGKVVWAVVQPGNLLLLCLLAGVIFFLASRGRRGRIPVGLAALGFLLLAVAPIGPAMLLALERRMPRPAVLPDKIDGILVLGGAVDPALSLSYGETVLNSAVARVLGGTALARRHPEAKLALIGGEGGFVPVGLAESRATLGFVIEQGIAPERVILEERSRSTHENAVYAKELISARARRDLDPDHLGLSHAPRCRLIRWGGLAGDSLSGRLQDRSADRSAREFQPARRARRQHPGGEGVGRPFGLSADGMDARAASRSGRGQSPFSALTAENTLHTTSKVTPLQYTNRYIPFPRSRERHI